VKLGSLGMPALLTIFRDCDLDLVVEAQKRFCFSRGIVFATLVGWTLGSGECTRQTLRRAGFQNGFLKLDILGALNFPCCRQSSGILFTDLFDSISTFIGVAHAANLLDEHGHPKNLKQGLIVDSFATLGAGLAGTSSGTAYI